MSSSKARFFNPAVVGLIMLSFFLGTSEYTVIGILPEIADGFGISLTQAGSIVSLFAFAYGLRPESGQSEKLQRTLDDTGRRTFEYLFLGKMS